MILVLKRYSWTLHFMTIALCSYLLAQSISTFIASRLESISLTPEKKEAATESETEEEGRLELDDFKAIAERNIFNSEGSGLAAEGEGEASPQMTGELGPAVKSSLDIKVLGVLAFGDGKDRRSSATIVSGKNGEGEVYYVGEEKSFAENVRLTKVEKNRIEFINGSRLEYAELEDFAASSKSIFASAEEVHGKATETSEATPAASEGGISSEGGKIVIDQSAIDEALANLDRFYTEVRIVPYFKAGKVAGMKILSVKPGSLIGKLGIKRGDILEKVNGRELDVKTGMQLFNELKDQKNFTIDLVRGGQNKTLEYEIR